MPSYGGQRSDIVYKSPRAILEFQGGQMRITGSMLVAAALMFFVGVSVWGQAAPYTLRLRTFASVAGGQVSRPVLLRSAGDGTHRIFVVQQTGIIKVFQPGATNPTDFIDLSSKITPIGNFGDERGLLGLTFHPQFTSNGKFYVDYSRVGDEASVIAEYQTVTRNGNSNMGDITTERILLVIPQPFPNHNSDMIEFGSDGYLYIGMGDGGSVNDPGNRSQNRANLLGKILRIDPNSTSPPYVIPPTNPFVGQDTGRCDNNIPTAATCQEIWAMGFRNPWRFSFDRQTDQLWIGDTGEHLIEEVDVLENGAGGGNYGWRVYEGTQCTNNDPGLCDPTHYLMPLFQYEHTGPRCAIVGGYVYRGTHGDLPFGGYVYGDYCTGEIFLWNGMTQSVLASSWRITSFGEDEDGAIYVCYDRAQIDKLVRAKASADLDGDLKTDIAVFRPSTGVWYQLNSSNGAFRFIQFGFVNDIPAPEDYDGDNITDIGSFRPSHGNWAYLRSSDATVVSFHWGEPDDIPASGDYDGDGRADPTVFRPSDGYWYIRSSAHGELAVHFGTSGDKPVAGDYDGDGRSDVCVWRESSGVWYRLNSSNGAFHAVQWGTTGDVPAQGDYDGDGKIDQAVFRPSTGVWYALLSTTGGLRATQWGVQNDVPVAGDYDGDGNNDVGVFRPSNGTWYILQSSNSSLFAIHWGTSGDIPVPSADTP